MITNPYRTASWGATCLKGCFNKVSSIRCVFKQLLGCRVDDMAYWSYKRERLVNSRWQLLSRRRVRLWWGTGTSHSENWEWWEQFAAWYIFFPFTFSTHHVFRCFMRTSSLFALQFHTRYFAACGRSQLCLLAYQHLERGCHRRVHP
jgi:hypothetical protein